MSSYVWLDHSKLVLRIAVAATVGCSGTPNAITCDSNSVGGAGRSNTCVGGGATTTGGATATTGNTSTGGIPSTGGVLSTGGVPSTGGGCNVSTPTNYGAACGSCGGTIDCTGACSVATPANLGSACGTCGGKIVCDGSCDFPGCGNTGYCQSATCIPYKTCAELVPPAGGSTAGAPCSRGRCFDSGNGQLIACDCTGSLVCSSSGVLVSSNGTPSPQGICCQNTATCPGGSANHCMVTGIPNDTCTGTPIKCGVTCGSSMHCTGPDGACTPDNNCSNIGVRMSLANSAQLRGGADGNPCNDHGTLYQKTGGGFFSCSCTQTASSSCIGETDTGEGTCSN